MTPKGTGRRTQAAFSRFLNDRSLAPQQIRFVEMVIDQLTARGVMDGLWPLTMAAQSCFGQEEWPEGVPEPTATIEFELADPSAVDAAVAEMKESGQEFVHETRILISTNAPQAGFAHEFSPSLRAQRGTNARSALNSRRLARRVSAANNPNGLGETNVGWIATSLRSSR